MIPINQDNMHWTLGVVNHRNKRVESVDCTAGMADDDYQIIHHFSNQKPRRSNYFCATIGLYGVQLLGSD